MVFDAGPWRPACRTAGQAIGGSESDRFPAYWADRQGVSVRVHIFQLSRDLDCHYRRERRHVVGGWLNLVMHKPSGEILLVRNLPAGVPIQPMQH